MRLQDGTYDKIKWIALAFIPALEVLILTVGKIWGLPYYDNIGATVAAVGVFLAALIRSSSKKYYAEIGSAEAIEIEEDESEEVRRLKLDKER